MRSPISRPGVRFAGLTLLLAIALAAAGCAGGTADAGAQSGSGDPLLPPTMDSEILGTLNGEEIVISDLADSDRYQLARLRTNYYTEVHDLLQQSATRTAREQLMLAAAEEQGMTLNLYYAEEVGYPEVSDAELQSIYDANRNQFGGRSLDEIGADLRRQVANQKLAHMIDAHGDAMLAEAEWELRVPDYRVEIETTGHAALGPEDAPLKLVVFSDFECPYCRRFNGTLDALRENEDYRDRIQVVFRHYPLRSIHPQAQKAAEASICAGDQDRFWEYHDALWTDENLGLETLEQHARLIGLDTEAFAECLNSGRHYQQVQNDFATARDLGLDGTPAVFANGRYLGGALPLPNLLQQIERELAASN